MDDTPLERLRDHLRSVESIDEDALLPLLVEAWPELQGCELCAMHAGKLSRACRFEWEPPILSFEIERHGAMLAGGSSRAERQVWHVDVEKAVADTIVVGYVQVEKRSPVFKTGPVAEELAEAIINCRNDPRLQWSKTGKVQVRTDKVLPAGRKQTTEGRRKRLNRDLEKRLAPLGWSRGRTGWWVPPNDSKRGTEGGQSGVSGQETAGGGCA